MEQQQRNNVTSLRERTLHVYNTNYNNQHPPPPTNIDVTARMGQFTNYGPNNERMSGTTLNNRQAMQISFCEFVGTAVIMFIGGLLGCSIEGKGFGYIVALQIFGHISGGHFNPAVTIAAIIMKKTQYILIPFYMLSQFIGAILGVLLLDLLIYDKTGKTLDCPTGILLLTEVQAMFIEFIMTALLVMAYCVLWDDRSHNHYDTAPLKIGLIVIGMGLVSRPHTNLSTNSALSLAPLVFHGKFKNHWIYWVGPNLGGACGAALYRFALQKRTWQFE